MRETIQRAKEFAELAHNGQKRKYTGLPYVTHTQSVARIVDEHGGDVAMVAAAHLHDTLEDTQTTVEGLIAVFGHDIAQLVIELTNVYEKAAYPTLNRAARKSREAVRLAGISARAQTIKFADFLDNGHDIVVNDPAFATTYLSEVRHDICQMQAGNPELRDMVLLMLGDKSLDSNR